MDRVLVAGIETVVGANVAATLANDCQVVGLSFSGPASIAACETFTCNVNDADSARHHASALEPDWIVLAGPASVSHWSAPSRKCLDILADSTRIFANIAKERGCRLAFVSSDAVFTGPWMFHAEDCTGLCASGEAESIRTAEETVLRLCPGSLVLRTNCFGWSPASTGNGWIEQILESLEAGNAGPFDFVRHGSPILATDFAEILKRACVAELSGVFHVAGGERINPARFVDQLADAFDLPAPRSSSSGSLSERPMGYGRGETSLQTKKIRAALGTAMPMVQDGLARLRAQRVNGFCEQLASPSRPVRDKVA